MSTRLTDSITAAAATVIVWMSGRQRGLAPRELMQPGPFVGGVVVAVVIELLFARWPERMGRLWKRPVVRIASPISLVLVTHFAGNREGGTIHAATLGGLAGYFGLLAGIVSGLVPDPRTWFERGGQISKRNSKSATDSDPDARSEAGTPGCVVNATKGARGACKRR